MSRLCAWMLGLALLGTGATVSAAEFCWKDSYGRGVGEVPSSCPAGQERIGLLCYDRCGPGMERSGFDCHSVCPSGMADQGLFCRRAEYGRGAGFAWQPQDGFSDDGMRRRCEAEHGRGNCEKNGAIYYPKCKAGYEAFGCCICRPRRPDCRALGLNPGIDLSCAKKVEIGSPETGTCPSGEEKDGGLCYERCRPGYDGVGPVCWGQAPRGWVNCGMGAAASDAACGQVVFNQVASVGQMAMFVGSLGTSSAGSAAAGSARAARIRRDFESLKRSWQSVRNRPEVQRAITQAQRANKIRQGYDVTQAMQTATTEEDMVRVAAQVAAILDPTGVSATVAAYTYSTCSDYFQGGGRPAGGSSAGGGSGPSSSPGASPPTSSSSSGPVSTGMPAIPNRPLTRDGVNGRNLVRVDHAGGRVEQAADGRWVESDGQGVRRFVFRETGRDDWSVYLNDPSRNVQLQLDVYRKKIRYGSGGGQRMDLYTIAAAWREGRPTPAPSPQPTATPRPPEPTQAPPAPRPQPAVQRSLTDQGVNGRNVVRADHAQGRLEQTADGNWTEFDASGRGRFAFVERQRDDWSVYLHDPSRNVQLQIDLHRRQISYGTNGGQRRDLYRVTRAWRPGTPATAQPPATGGGFSQQGVNGRNLARADFAGGRVERTGQGDWVEYGADGRARFRFRETGRDDWSVYLHDASRNVQLQLDVHRRMISYGSGGGPRSDLYPITAAWRR